MTQFASATQGMMDGMRIGMEMRNRKSNEQYREDQNRRANEQHAADMEMQPVRLETARLNNDIARQSAELAKTNSGFEELKRMAGGVGAFLGATANGQPVSPDAAQAAKDAVQAYFGNMINEGGPAHLDQRVSNVQMTPRGAVLTLNNTNRETGESYEAPMTVGRQAGEKTVAAIPAGDMLGFARQLIKTAVENGVDPRVVSNGFSGGEQWVDGRNANGVYGQRNVVTGKFDEGRESVGERIAASRAGAIAAKDAELNWQERNADRIAEMDLNRERKKLEMNQKLNDEHPEIAERSAAKERMNNYNDVVKSIYSKIGAKDEQGNVYTGEMANRAATEAALRLGVYDQVKDRLPPIGLSENERMEADAQADADVENTLGMWAKDDTIKRFGGASNRDEARNYQREKYREEALKNKMAGMGLKPQAQPAQQPQQATSQQEAALKWLKENPNDPRAAEIKRRLGL